MKRIYFWNARKLPPGYIRDTGRELSGRVPGSTHWIYQHIFEVVQDFDLNDFVEPNHAIKDHLFIKGEEVIVYN